MRPVLCMITDRRRHGGGWERALVDRVAAAAYAGVHLIQIRERDLDGRALTHLVERCVAAVSCTLARIVVNDRLDIALAAGAHGAHLRADSAPASRVRAAVSRRFLVGRSIHSCDEARQGRQGGSLDYVIFGSVFESRSKPNVDAAGPDTLANAVSATTIPVLAVGGVTPDRVHEIAKAGGAGIAGIGLFADCALEALPIIVAQVDLAFDMPESVP